MCFKIYLINSRKCIFEKFKIKNQEITLMKGKRVILKLWRCRKQFSKKYEFSACKKVMTCLLVHLKQTCARLLNTPFISAN